MAKRSSTTFLQARGTVDLRPKEQQVAAPAAAQDQEEDEAEIEAVGEDFTPQNGNGEAEESRQPRR